MLHRAIQQSKPMARGFWFVNIFLEIALPAVSIASAASSVIQPGYRPLANPSFLIYFLLLMLTILRLDPPLSVLCGFLAAGRYLAAWNQPADETGGDYYDWQSLPNGKFVTALADVTGHGIGPALLASVCRAYARTNFRNQDSFLKAMEEINSAIAADVREGRFITFVAAIFGADSPTVELLSAGHAPLFLYTLKNDRFDMMEAHGLPLGISDAFLSDPPHSIEMPSGDLLLLPTDGFFEWENVHEEQFGHET